VVLVSFPLGYFLCIAISGLDTEENKKPSVHFNMKIREGFVAHENTPLPARNLFLNFDTRLPSLDVEQLAVKIDSIYFEVGKDFLNGNVLLN